MSRSRRYALAIVVACALLVLLFAWIWTHARQLADTLVVLLLLADAAVIAYLVADARASERSRKIALDEVQAQLAERESKLERSVRELSILHEISLAATASVGVDDVLRNATDAMRETLPYSHLAVFLSEAGSGRLVIRTGYGEGFDKVMQTADLTIGEGVTGNVVATGQPALIADVRCDARYANLVGMARSEVCVPMKIGDQIIGGINVESPQPNAFGGDDVRLLLTIGSQLAIILENARLFDDARRAHADLRQRVQELTTIQQISLRLVSSLDLQTVLQEIAESTLRLIEATDVHLFLYDEARQELTSGTALWANGEHAPTSATPRPDGLTMTAVRERRPIVIQDATSHPLYANPEAQAWGVKAIASLPLLRAGAAVGALNVAFLHAHTFTDDELRVLGLLADQAAIAVENARLHEQLAEQAKRDSLTQVYNHGHILSILAEAVKRAVADCQPLAYIMLDIDHFKEYNDRHGHVTGDVVLRSIVQSIQSNIKRTDAVGRWGGEEFGIILPGADAAQAEMIAQRIRATVANFQLDNGKGLRIANPTVSQGIACCPDHAEKAEDLIDLADRALYRAKARGRDQVIVAPKSRR